MTEETPARSALRADALHYHAMGQPGKLEVRVTKPMANARDLSLAYSPGVADACTAIAEDAANAARYTGRGNLVAVVSNGTAVLGLGNIGALASKPVMEGKSALFKKFANINCYDIEVDETDPHKLAAIVKSLEPTFGAINLEDIKAPDCFIVEDTCKATMNIPVFHDDQHGTAIVVGAAAYNALRIANKKFEDIRLVSVGGGAAGTACIKLLIGLGVKKENVIVCDREGVIYTGRPGLTEAKSFFAVDTEFRTLDEAIDGADMFLGLAGPGALTGEQVKRMAPTPLIFALANPTPEITPEEVKAVRDDALIATGRSDYPNQVNNVLCFPFIFRGALDVGATVINEEMKFACVKALADLAHAPSTAEAAAAYRGERLVFGKEYLIPKPFDPRLLAEVAGAVAQTAMETGVATRPLEDIEVYKASLNRSVYKTAFLMKPVFDSARTAKRRIVFAEGESERVLRTAQALRDEGVDTPIVIGRPRVIEQRIEQNGMNLKLSDLEVVNPEDDPRFRDYWGEYHSAMQRRGVTPQLAQAILRTNTTAIASVMVRKGEADSMICGTFGQYLWHLNYVTQMLETEDLKPIGALSPIMLDSQAVFIADTQVNPDPTPEQIAATAIAASRHVRRFGLEPKIALLSHSVFGSLDTESGRKMRAALAILDSAPRDFMYEGEMHADMALVPELRERIFPNSRLKGAANTLLFPNADAASGARNMMKVLGKGLEIGPILMGMGNRVHIVSPTITARGLLNVAALAGSPVAHYS